MYKPRYRLFHYSVRSQFAFEGIKHIFPRIAQKIKEPTNEEMKDLRPHELYHLAYSYLTGTKKNTRDLFEKDKLLATKYFFIAKEKGSLDAHFQLIVLALSGDIDQSLIVSVNESLVQLSNKGHVPSMALLAKFYKEGTLFIDKDLNSALELYERLAEIDPKPEEEYYYECMDAVLALREIYFMRGNMKQAYYYLDKAVMAKDLNSIFILGNWFNEGTEFTPKDTTKAFNLFKIAADNGHMIAIHNLSCCYFSGNGCQADPQKGIEYLKKSAEAGYLPSKLNLASIVAEGEFVDQDITYALVLCNDIISSDIIDKYESIKKATLELTERIKTTYNVD